MAISKPVVTNFKVERRYGQEVSIFDCLVGMGSIDAKIFAGIVLDGDSLLFDETTLNGAKLANKVPDKATYEALLYQIGLMMPYNYGKDK